MPIEMTLRLKAVQQTFEECATTDCPNSATHIFVSASDDYKPDQSGGVTVKVCEECASEHSESR